MGFEEVFQRFLAACPPEQDVADCLADQATARQAASDANAAEIAALDASIADGATSMDVGWLIFAGTLVFMMHAGFALLEAGYVRQKNFQAILFKGMFTITSAAITWNMMGFGIALGKHESEEDSYYGTDHFFLGEEELGAEITDVTEFPYQNAMGTGYAVYFFQWTFCATCATIISGAVAERVHMAGYAIIAIYVTTVTYPVIVHWTWGGGWLAQYGPLNEAGDVVGFNDFAGSGVVHMCGGFSAITAAAVLGRRIDFYASKAKIRRETDGIKDPKFVFAEIDEIVQTMNENVAKEGEAEYTAEDFLVRRFDTGATVGAQTNPLYITLGTFLLWFGWFGFNAGSTGALSGGSSMTAARCCATTMLAASTGGLGYVAFNSMINKMKQKNLPDTERNRLFTVAGYGNGILGGLVGITAGCSNMDLDGAMMTGLIGGIVVDLASRMEDSMGIDDVVGAFPVHGMAGFWGLIAAGMFDMDTGATATTTPASSLGPNMVGAFSIAMFSVCSTLPLYIILRLIPLDGGSLLRVSIRTEEIGLDDEFESVNAPMNVINQLDQTRQNMVKAMGSV